MKKVLFATTALSLVAAGSALAEPTVTVGGYADFQVGSASQDGTYEAASTTYNRDTHTRTETNVNVKVDGRTDSGLGYGAYIELEADVNAPEDQATANNNANRTYLYVESGYGRAEAGANTSASEALKVDASTFARGTGGVGGDFYNYVDLGGQADPADDTFIVTPDLPTSGFINLGATDTQPLDSKDVYATANKVSYYSPRIQGAQLGVSYTPDLEERGTAVGFSGDTGTGQASIKDIWNAGVNYQGEYSGVGVELAAVGEMGDQEVSTRDDLKAYTLGGSLNYAGVTVGGSWSDISEFGATTTLSQDADFWTAGAAYEFGPFAASVSYLESQIQHGANDADAVTDADAEFNNLVLGADYQLAPGLVPYVEVAFFDTDDNTANTVDNDGSVVLFGTELSF